jgi:hypothetical protein
LKYTLIVFSCLLFIGMVYSRSDDECHVYLVDGKAATKAMEKLFQPGSKMTEEEHVKEMAKAVKTFDPFVPRVGEEELTTKHYPIPDSKYFISASVFYTDESFGLEKKGEDLLYDFSIKLSVVVSMKKVANVMGAENNAMAESTYNDGTMGLRVSKNVKIDRREYLVGLECHCNESHLPKP